jgi:hypothetical protein
MAGWQPQPAQPLLPVSLTDLEAARVTVPPGTSLLPSLLLMLPCEGCLAHAVTRCCNKMMHAAMADGRQLCFRSTYDHTYDQSHCAVAQPLR